MTTGFASAIRKVFQALSPVSDASVEAIAAVSVEKRFKVRQTLLAAGERAEWCYLITQGLVRELYLAPVITDQRGDLLSSTGQANPPHQVPAPAAAR